MKSAGHLCGCYPGIFLKTEEKSRKKNRSLKNKTFQHVNARNNYTSSVTFFVEGMSEQNPQYTLRHCCKDHLVHEIIP
jgi:hypothetical protein